MKIVGKFNRMVQEVYVITSRIIAGNDMKILIHDDYCHNINAEDISNILSQIGILVSNSYRHSGQSVVEQTECTGQKVEI